MIISDDLVGPHFGYHHSLLSTWINELKIWKCKSFVSIKFFLILQNNSCQVCSLTLYNTYIIGIILQALGSGTKLGYSFVCIQFNYEQYHDVHYYLNSKVFWVEIMIFPSFSVSLRIKMWKRRASWKQQFNKYLIWVSKL